MLLPHEFPDLGNSGFGRALRVTKPTIEAMVRNDNANSPYPYPYWQFLSQPVVADARTLATVEALYPYLLWVSTR